MLRSKKLSKHIAYDRAERVAYIGQTCGFGEAKYMLEHDGRYYSVTSTGVVFVLDKDKETIITVLIPQIEKMTAMFLSNGYEAVPPLIYNAVMKNISKGYCKGCP